MSPSSWPPVIAIHLSARPYPATKPSGPERLEVSDRWGDLAIWAAEEILIRLGPRLYRLRHIDCYFDLNADGVPLLRMVVATWPLRSRLPTYEVTTLYRLAGRSDYTYSALTMGLVVPMITKLRRVIT